MDGDGTPELIFNDGGEWYQYYSHVCTIRDGNVWYLGRIQAPLGNPYAPEGEQQFCYHYYNNTQYPGLFVETYIPGYYNSQSDHYCGYYRITSDGQIVEEVVEASASGRIIKKTTDDALYRLFTNETAIPLRFTVLEDILAGEWVYLWNS